MQAVVRECLVESHRNLDRLDRDLVALGRAPGSTELLGSAFVCVRDIRRAGAFLGFEMLERVAQAGQVLLAGLRDGRRPLDRPTADALLLLAGTVRAILDSIEACGAEGDVAVDVVVAQVHAVGEGRLPHAPLGNALEVVGAVGWLLEAPGRALAADVAR